MDWFDIMKKLTRGLDAPLLPELVDPNGTDAVLENSVPKVDKNCCDKSASTIRRQNQIHVCGDNIADPIVRFEDIGENIPKMSATFKRNLIGLEFNTLTPIQMQSIPILLQNRNLMACAPTGSGKTLAFLVPILARLSCSNKPRGLKALILAPSRELALQIFKQAESLTRGMPIRCLRIKNPKVLEAKSKTKKFAKYNVLITTPQRLVFLLVASNCLNLSTVKYLVMDEADKLFQSGNRSFREQLGVIIKALTNPNLERCMFSATYSNDVEQWCRLNMDDLLQLTVGQRNVAVNTVEQKLIYAGNEQGKIFGLRNLFYEGLQGPLLIFVQTKQRAAELFKELLYDGKMVASIHSNLTQSQRNKIMDAFEKGKIWVLICTDLFGRGLDFRNIRTVINYDLPDSAVTYIHRIGRTGRAGETGKAFSFFTDSDIPRMRSIANVVKQSGANVPDYLLRIKKLKKTAEKRVFSEARLNDKLKARPRRRRKPLKSKDDN